MATVLSRGVMAESIKDRTSTIGKMATAFTPGPMVVAIKDSGRMENNMVLAYSLLGMELRSMETGVTGKDLRSNTTIKILKPKLRFLTESIISNLKYIFYLIF